LEDLEELTEHLPEKLDILHKEILLALRRLRESIEGIPVGPIRITLTITYIV